MNRSQLTPMVLELPEDDRLEMMTVISASLTDRDALPLPDWQRDLLDERLALSAGDPGEDWETVKAELWPAVK